MQNNVLDYLNDIVKIKPEKTGQMIKFKGTTIYPPVLFDILDNIPDVENYIVEVFTNSLGTDQIQIRIGSSNHSEAFIKQIKDIFRSKVRVAPDIQFARSRPV